MSEDPKFLLADFATAIIFGTRDPHPAIDFFTRDRLAMLHADLEALADHRGEAFRHLWTQS